MSECARISSKDAREKVEQNKALLVCAYAEDAKFKKAVLEGAISFSDFQSKLASVPKNQEIIFY